MRREVWRNGVVALTALFILAPVGLIVWQSFLTDAFFNARAAFTTSTYAFVLSDPGFWDALRNTLILSVGMVAIAVPLGSLLAFLMVRTDLPGRRWIEPAIFLPLFMSPMVTALPSAWRPRRVSFFTVTAISWLCAPRRRASPPRRTPMPRARSSAPSSAPSKPSVRRSATSPAASSTPSTTSPTAASSCPSRARAASAPPRSSPNSAMSAGASQTDSQLAAEAGVVPVTHASGKHCGVVFRWA
jgi:hypothetical protein